MWKLYEVQTSSSINNILLGHSHAPLFIIYSRQKVWTEAPCGTVILYTAVGWTTNQWLRYTLCPRNYCSKKKKKKIHTQKFFLWNVKTVWNSNFKFHYTLHSCWVNHKSVTQSYLTPPWITVAYCYFSSHYQCILFMSEQEEKGKNWDYACLLLRHSRRWTILSNEVAKRYYYAIILK